MNDFSVSNRFVNVNIGIHWQVDTSESPFKRLLKHFQVRTQFYNGFCKAFNYLLENLSVNNMIIADVGWDLDGHPRLWLNIQV